MSLFEIRGGKKISGSISVRGAKNFALKAIAASLLTEEPCRITNMPAIVDVGVMLDLIKKLGGEVERKGVGEVVIKSRCLDGTSMDPADAQRVRASIVLTGPILARFGAVTIPHPGGDVIGKRPVNFFMEGFARLGAKVKELDTVYKITHSGRLKGGTVFFPKISVTGTETMVMAATLAEGKTVLRNAAMEPEVSHLCTCLNRMGARIEGIGTSTLVIQGVKKLKGGLFDVIPDRIETGTFVMMGIMNNAHIRVSKCNPPHLEALWDLLDKAGAKIKMGRDWVETVPIKERIRSVGVQAHEYPGFATDLQPIYTLLMTQATGSSLIHDPIFEGRLFFTDILNRMGANIVMCDPHRVVVAGPTKLVAKRIESPDIRAGITLLLAGMLAKGTSIIDNAEIIDRGYERIEERLKPLGVDIARREI